MIARNMKSLDQNSEGMSSEDEHESEDEVDCAKGDECNKVCSLDMNKTETLLSSTILEATFPHKLYHILQNEEYKEIIAWLPHGRSWKILNRIAFVKRVLPLYFRHQQFPSFKRQLSGWEFKRGIKECAFNEYHHPLFMRDHPELLLKMKRRKQKRVSKVNRLHANRNDQSIHNGRNVSSMPVNNQLTRMNLPSNDVLNINQYSMNQNSSTLLQFPSNTLSNSQASLLKALQGMESSLNPTMVPHDNVAVQNIMNNVSSTEQSRSIISVSDFINQCQNVNQVANGNNFLNQLQTEASRSGVSGLSNNIQSNIGSYSAAPSPAQAVLLDAIEQLRQRNIVQLLQQLRNHGITTTNTGPTPRLNVPISSNSSTSSNTLGGNETVTAAPLLNDIRLALLQNRNLGQQQQSGNVHASNDNNNGGRINNFFRF